MPEPQLSLSFEDSEVTYMGKVHSAPDEPMKKIDNNTRATKRIVFDISCSYPKYGVPLNMT